MHAFTFFGLVSGIVGPLVLYFGFRRLKLKRRVQNLPTSKARSMAMGLVELQGKVGMTDELLDPIENLPCAFFRILIEQKTTERRGNSETTVWTTIYDDNSEDTPFTCEDETGKAWIVPTHADIFCENSVTIEKGLLDRGSSISNWVDVLANKKKINLRDKRVTLTVLRPGETVYILGVAQKLSEALELVPKFTYQDASRKLAQQKYGREIKVESINDAVSLVKDLFAQASSEYVKKTKEHQTIFYEEKKARIKTLASQQDSLGGEVVVSKGKKTPLIISHDENYLVKKLSNWTTGLVVFGLILISLSTYLLLIARPS